MRVKGAPVPESVKPDPVTAAALTVTATEPVEVRVTDCVAGAFRLTLPKVRLVALMLSVGVPVPSCRVKVFDIPPAVAVNVTVCAVLTEETVDVKLALVEPDGTVIAAGTATEELLLARLTANPLLGAAEFRVTVQPSVPVAVIELLVQVNPVNTGGAPSCRAKVFDIPPAVAVNVTV